MQSRAGPPSCARQLQGLMLRDAGNGHRIPGTIPLLLVAEGCKAPDPGSRPTHPGCRPLRREVPEELSDRHPRLQLHRQVREQLDLRQVSVHPTGATLLPPRGDIADGRAPESPILQQPPLCDSILATASWLTESCRERVLLGAIGHAGTVG